LSRIVLGVFTGPLSSNRRLIVALVCWRVNVFTKSLRSNGYTRHNIITRFYRHDKLSTESDTLSVVSNLFYLRIATGWTASVGFSAQSKNLFSNLIHRVQTGSGPHPASYTWVTGAHSPRVKRPKRDAHHSRPSIIPRKIMIELYVHSHIRLHGIVLN
jgi:hypothetical protein